MATYADRVRERLRVLGYWKNGKPDVGRFCVDKGFIPSYVYRWIDGQVPRGPALIRLALALGVSVEWLIGPVPRPGRRRSALPISGGSGNDGTPPLSPSEAGSLLSDYRRAWWSRPWWSPVTSGHVWSLA